MTHAAITLSIVDTETGALRGVGLVCSAARFASVLWNGADRIERVFFSPQAWRDVEQETGLGLPARELTAPVWPTFTGHRGGRVQWIGQVPVEIGKPEEAATVLDGLLRSIKAKDEPAKDSQ